MRILYLVNHLNVGGISSYLLSLSSALLEQGNQVYIASSGGELEEKFKTLGAQLIKISIRTKNEASPKILLSFLKLRGLIKKYQIQVVHSQSRTTQVLGCLLGKYTKVKHIFTCHGFFNPKISRRFFPCLPDKAIAISQPVAKHLIEDLNFPESKIFLVVNGIEARFFRSPRCKEEIRKSLGLKPGEIIGSVGRLSDVKGHAYLISAMPLILRNFPQAQLLISGEGKLYNHLFCQAKQLAISDKVFFVRNCLPVADILTVLDLFVMPSLQEGLGLALMEAMSVGLAVVGTNVGGIKELIKDRQNGILVEPRNAQALADAINQLLADSAQRQRLGTQAEKFIRDNFALSKMAAQTLGVYQECLK